MRPITGPRRRAFISFAHHGSQGPLKYRGIMQNLAVPALWHQDNGGVTRARQSGQGGSWRSRCLLPGLLRPSKRTSSNPTTASFHLHSFFLFLLPSACISTCSFCCWSFVRRPLLYCVCCMQSTGSAGPFATQPCVQLRCHARCRPRKRLRAYDKKANRLGPVNLLWSL